MASVRRLSDDGALALAEKQPKQQQQHHRDLFRNCALIEIIHLHDCLRGAVKALERDVQALNRVLTQHGAAADSLKDLEKKVFGRFKVIWSVFRAHSTAEGMLCSFFHGLVENSFLICKYTTTIPYHILYYATNFLIAPFVLFSLVHLNNEKDEFIWPALRRKTQLL